MKRKVIVVTDGDSIAQKSVEYAAYKLNIRTISASAGNPTHLSGLELVDLVKQTPYDPVVVMFDDRGAPHKGKGERALEVLGKHPDIEIIGALAVASNTNVKGIRCDVSITNEGNVVSCAVDKLGTPLVFNNKIQGDTVDVLNELDVPLVVGIGDLGKMEEKDDIYLGSEITTKAFKYILNNWRNTDDFNC